MKKTSKLPRIYIVIPSYNAEKFISQTLKSIVSQQYDNLEIIIQDGGSTDKTPEIVRPFTEKYKYIKWESKKDDGQLDAITEGLRKSSGEIITFINSDDIYHENVLRIVGDTFLKDPALLWIAGQGDVIDENNEKIALIVTFYKNMLLKLNSYSVLLAVNYLMQPSVFISRDAYKMYGPFTGNKRYILEYEMWLKLGKVKMPKIINRPLSAFRLHSNSFSLNQTQNILKDDMEIANKFTKNKVLLFIHSIHNQLRFLFIK